MTIETLAIAAAVAVTSPGGGDTSAPAAIVAPVQPIDTKTDATTKTIPVAVVAQQIENTAEAKAPAVPSFDKEVIKPLQALQAQEANTAMRQQCEGWGGSYSPFSDSVAAVCTLPPPPPVASFSEVRVTQQDSGGISVSYSSFSSGLVGSIGYAQWGGNCVNEPGVNNPGWGNPIDWPATSMTPWIGATVLFTYNHTGVVTGIWPNGDLEIRHENFKGTTHRFPRSAFRGFR